MNKVFEIIKYIIIGIIQGISEIFPISSSGHLAICYYLFNVSSNDQLNLTIFLHFASTIALIVFFKDKLKVIIKDFFLYMFSNNKQYKTNFMLVIYLFFSCIPIGIVGLLLKDIVDSLFSSLLFISFGFLLTSVFLLIFEKIKYKDETYTFKNTFIPSMLQSICIFPGVSRSATTLLSLKLFKIKETKAKEYCFLLLIPISFSSFILSFFDENILNIINSNNIVLYIISMIVTFVFTLLSLRLFFYKNVKIKYFILYLLSISFLTFILYFF